MIHKTETAVLLLKKPLNAGINAQYDLMDTWFTTEPMIAEFLNLGIDTIGMVNQLKQRYAYEGKQYKLSELKKFVSFEGARNIWARLTWSLLFGPDFIIAVSFNRITVLKTSLSTNCGIPPEYVLVNL